MDAVRLLARSETRQRLSSLVFVGVLVAVVVGVVLALVGGARRTSSVLDRFHAATNAPDAMVGVFWPPFAQDPDEVASVRAQLASLGGVDDVAVSLFVIAGADTELDFGIVTGPDAGYTETNRPIVVAGRLPALDDPNEIALTERTARELGLSSGDRFVVPTMAPATFVALVLGDGGFALDGPLLELDVVGVVRDSDDLRPDNTSGPLAYASPAFLAEREVALSSAVFMIDGEPSGIDIDEVVLALSPSVPPGGEVFGGLGLDDSSTRVSFETLANGLLVSAALAGLTGLVAVSLAIGRHLQQAHSDGRAVAAVGMTRIEIAAGWAAPVTFVVALGVAAGAAGSVLASWAFPMSIARRAEVEPGVRVDLATVGIGSLVALGAFCMVVAWVSWRGARITLEPARRRPIRAVERSAVWSRVRSALTAPASIGTSLVLEPRRGRSALPLAAIAGAVLAVGGVVGVATFVSSQRASELDVARSGTVWSSHPDVAFDRLDEPFDDFVARLAADQRLETVGGLFCDLTGVLGEQAPVCALQVVDGSMAPAISSGRAPTAPGEIALGSLSARRLGASIGSTVSIGDGGPFTVVGTAVMPTVHTERPGLGAYVSEEGLLRLTGAESVFDLTGKLLLGYPEGVDPADVEPDLARDYPALEFSPYSTPQPPDVVTQLGRLRTVLLGLTGFLVAVASIGTLHYLLLSTRRRRSQNAVLQAIGMVRRDVRRVVSWQAATVAAIGVAVGTPVGLLIGRSAWLALVDDLGMIDAPTTPWSVLLLTPVAFVGAAVLLSWYPARRAARSRPAAGLRGE